MQYTRGKKGPVSRMAIEVSNVEITEAGANSRARGGGVATMAHGRLKAVDFQIQGKHLDDARDGLTPGGEIDADVRWVGGTAVTVVKVHGVKTGRGSLATTARRRAGIDAQISALFG